MHLCADCYDLGRLTMEAMVGGMDLRAAVDSSRTTRSSTNCASES
jgi:hypothetical protein